jgi:hypothetical protein
MKIPLEDLKLLHASDSWSEERQAHLGDGNAFNLGDKIFSADYQKISLLLITIFCSILSTQGYLLTRRKLRVRIFASIEI